MSRVEHVEGQVKSLSLDELKAFRDWFAQFDAEVWDDQIEADAKNGKLRPLLSAPFMIMNRAARPFCDPTPRRSGFLELVSKSAGEYPSSCGPGVRFAEG